MEIWNASAYPTTIQSVDTGDCYWGCLSPQVLHNEASGTTCGSSRSLPSRTLSFPSQLASFIHLQIPTELEHKFQMKEIWAV